MDNNEQEEKKEENVLPPEDSESKDKNKPAKKMTLADFKVKSFVTQVKVEQMQFLKTAGG